MKFGVYDTETRKLLHTSMFSDRLDAWIEERCERDESGRRIWPDEWNYMELPTDGHDLVNMIKDMADLASIALFREREKRPAVIVESKTAKGGMRTYLAVIPGAAMVVEFDEMVVDGYDNNLIVLRRKGVDIAEWCEADDFATEVWRA